MNDDESDNLKTVMVVLIEKVEFNKNSYPYSLSELASFHIFRIYAIDL